MGDNWLRLYRGSSHRDTSGDGVRVSLHEGQEFENLLRAIAEISRLRGIITLASQAPSLIVAKHAIGKDRTAVRMTKYLNAERRK